MPLDPRLYQNRGTFTSDPYARHIQTYQRQPWLFSEDQVDELEEYAKANDIEFQRQIDPSGSGLIGVANQLTSGIVEGFTTLGWADEPETTAESIAYRVGHLIGFAPDIIAGVVSGGATAGASLAKMAGKKGVKKVAQDRFSTKLAQGMQKAVKGEFGIQAAATQRASDFFGREFTRGPLALRSVPMRVADWATGAGGRMMADAGWDAAKFLQEGHWGRSIIKQAGHLGIASGVSAWQEGPEGALKASMHGAVAGAAFGGIGNFMQVDKMLKSGIPSMEAEARTIIETVAKGMAGSAFTGIPSTMRGEDPAAQIYEYLLGFFFGASTQPAWKEAGMKVFNEASQRAETAFQPQKLDSFAKLNKSAKDFVLEQTKNAYGRYSKDANLSQAAIEILKNITGKDNPTLKDYQENFKEVNRDIVKHIDQQYQEVKEPGTEIKNPSETTIVPGEQQSIEFEKKRYFQVGAEYNDKTPLATKNEIVQHVSDIMGPHATRTRDMFLKEIKENPEAVGMYVDGMVQFVEGKVTHHAAVHEPIHWFMGKVLTQQEYSFLQRQFKQKNELATEEAIVNAASEYYLGKKTFTGKVKALLQKFWRQIKTLLGKDLTDGQSVQELFDRIGTDYTIRSKDNLKEYVSKDRGNLERLVEAEVSVKTEQNDYILYNDYLDFTGSKKAGKPEGRPTIHYVIDELINVPQSRYNPRQTTLASLAEFHFPELKNVSSLDYYNPKQIAQMPAQLKEARLTLDLEYKFVNNVNDVKSEKIGFSGMYKSLSKNLKKAEKIAARDFVDRLKEKYKDQKSITKEELVKEYNEFIEKEYPFNAYIALGYENTTEKGISIPYGAENIIKNIKTVENPKLIENKKVMFTGGELYDKLGHQFEILDPRFDSKIPDISSNGYGWYNFLDIKHIDPKLSISFEYQSDLFDNLAKPTSKETKPELQLHHGTRTVQESAEKEFRIVASNKAKQNIEFEMNRRGLGFVLNELVEWSGTELRFKKASFKQDSYQNTVDGYLRNAISELEGMKFSRYVNETVRSVFRDFNKKLKTIEDKYPRLKNGELDPRAQTERNKAAFEMNSIADAINEIFPQAFNMGRVSAAEKKAMSYFDSFSVNGGGRSPLSKSASLWQTSPLPNETTFVNTGLANTKRENNWSDSEYISRRQNKATGEMPTPKEVYDNLINKELPKLYKILDSVNNKDFTSARIKRLIDLITKNHFDYKFALEDMGSTYFESSRFLDKKRLLGSAKSDKLFDGPSPGTKFAALSPELRIEFINQQNIYLNIIKDIYQYLTNTSYALLKQKDNFVGLTDIPEAPFNSAGRVVGELNNKLKNTDSLIKRQTSIVNQFNFTLDALNVKTTRDKLANYVIDKYDRFMDGFRFQLQDYIHEYIKIGNDLLNSQVKDNPKLNNYIKVFQEKEAFRQKQIYHALITASQNGDTRHILTGGKGSYEIQRNSQASKLYLNQGEIDALPKISYKDWRKNSFKRDMQRSDKWSHEVHYRMFGRGEGLHTMSDKEFLVWFASKRNRGVKSTNRWMDITGNILIRRARDGNGEIIKDKWDFTTNRAHPDKLGTMTFDQLKRMLKDSPRPGPFATDAQKVLKKLKIPYTYEEIKGVEGVNIVAEIPTDLDARIPRFFVPAKKDKNLPSLSKKNKRNVFAYIEKVYREEGPKKSTERLMDEYGVEILSYISEYDSRQMGDVIPRTADPEIQLALFPVDKQKNIETRLSSQDDRSMEIIPKFNVLDQLVDYIKPFSSRTSGEIRRDLDIIAVANAGSREEFFKHLYEYMPKEATDRPENFEKRVIKHLDALSQHEPRRMLYWSEENGLLYQTEMHPSTEASKKYGQNVDQTLRRVTREVSGVDQNGQPYEFSIQLKPLGQNPGYFSVAQQTYIEPTNALNPKSWRSLTLALDQNNSYVFGGNGTTGVLSTRVYHRKTNQTTLQDLKKEMFREKDFALSFQKTYEYAKDLFLGQQMHGIDAKKNPKTVAKYEQLFDKQLISNLLYSFEENGSWRTSFMEYPNVVAFNKRQPLEQGVEYMLSRADVSDLLNSRGKLEYAIVKDVPGEVGADTDGGIYLHPELFNRVAERFNQDPETGFIKAVGVVGNQKIERNGKEVDLGKNRDKAGFFRATKEMADFMDAHGLRIIKRESGTKTLGDRQTYNIDFKNGKYKFVGKGSRNPEFYEMLPEEFKVNVGIYDDARKVYGNMNMPKPVLSLINSEQFSPEAMNAAMDKITGPAIYGTAESNAIMKNYIADPKKYAEGLVAKFGDTRVGKINLDDVSHHLIMEALRMHPDKQIAKDILRFIFRKHKEYSVENPADDKTMQFNKDIETISPTLDLLENANFELAVWMQPDVFKYVNKAIMNYFVRRAFKPKWKNSGYARFIDNTEQLKQTYNVQEGEFYFGHARQSEKIEFPFNGHKRPITRGQAYKEYLRAQKQGAPKETLESMLDHLSALFTRVPAPVPSGVRFLTFRGFLKEKDGAGYGMLINERDKYFFGGADNDGDLAYFFHNMPKEIVEGYKSAKNELVKKDGSLKDIKDPKYYPLFGINESDPLFKAMNTPASTFMPSLRISAARGAFMGQNNTGPMVNSNQMLQALYSTINNQGGEMVFNANKFKLRIKLKKQADEAVAGDMLRELSLNAISNAVDAANYPNMSSARQMKEKIFNKIFEVTKVGEKGQVLKFGFSDLYKTEFMQYWRLNNLLFGWNFQQNRPHTVQEILSGLKDYRNSGIKFDSHMSKAALEFGDLNMDIDPWSFLNKKALATELRVANKLFKEENGKRFMRLIGREKLDIYGQTTFKSNIHTVNDFSDFIAARSVIYPLGERIEKAMNDLGYEQQRVYEIIDYIADKATALKNTGWKVRMDARDQDVPLADIQARIDSEIIREHGKLSDMARQLGIEPKLLTTYYDAYILSPLKFQNPDSKLSAKLKELVKLRDEYNNSELPVDEKSVALLQKEITDLNKQYNQTTRMSIGWLSTRIPREVKAAYLQEYSKEFNKYIVVPSNDPVVRVPEPNVKQSAPEPTMPEVASKIPKDVLEKTLDVDLGKITPEQQQSIDTFVRNLDQFPQFKEAINLAVPGVTAQLNLIGVPIENISFQDIRVLNRMFDQWKRGILGKKIKEGDFGKFPMKAIYNYLFYSRIDELLTPHDMKMLDVHNTPVYRISKHGSAGEISFEKTKVPMSTMGAIQKMAGHAYNYENKFVEFWEDELDRRFSFMSELKEAPEMIEIAVRHITRNGDGRDYNGSDRGNAKAVYEKMWKEIAPEYEALLKKGNVMSLKDEKGNVYKANAQEVLHKIKDTIRDFYKEWYETFLNKGYDESKVLNPKTGLLNDNWVRDEILSPMVRDLPFGRIDLKGMPAIARIEYEMSLIDLLDAQGVKGEAARKAKAAKYRLDHPPPSAEAPPIGKVPFEFYWSQMGHIDTKFAKQANIKAMQENLIAYEKAMREGTAKLATEMLEFNYRNGTITLEQGIKESINITKQRYEKALQTSVKGDNSYSESGVEWLHFKPEGVQEMSAIRMFQKPGSAMHRGYLPLPEFRRDIGVLKDYMRQWMKAYFNNIIAIRARYAIKDFERRGPVGEDTAVWRDFFLDASKNIMGYPSFFSEKIFGITHPQARAVRKFLDKGKSALSKKQLNTIKDLVQKIDEEYIAKSGGPYMASLAPLKPEDYRFKLQEMLKSTNRLKAYRTGYYAFSDQKAVQFLDKVSKKLFNGEIPFYKDFPKDPEVRKAVMTRMVHKFGIMDGKWNLMTLLAAPKSFIGNVMGGSENIIGSAGLRHFRGAINKQYLINEVFKNATFEMPGPEGKKVKVKIDSIQNLNLWLETIGVIDSYIKSEIGLDSTFKPDRNKRFAVAAGRKVAALFHKNKLDDKTLRLTLRETAREYGVSDAIVNKAAGFMRKSELINRRNAFLAHYLNAREVFAPVTDMLPWDSEALVRFGKKGLEATQFLYHSAFRTNYSNTALGKVMTRFQPFAWNSVKYRRHVYQNAKLYGFKPGTRAFDRYQRQVTTDMFAMALAGIFAGSIFEYTLAPPMAWMQDTAQWLFGDEKERERAFFTSWPTTALAPLQPITPPIARYPLNVLSTIINGDMEKFGRYYAWTWFPFGRVARDLSRSIPNPAMSVDFMTGFPLHGVHRKVRKYIENRQEQELALEI